MKAFYATIICVFLGLGSACGQTNFSDSAQRKVVFIIVDGISADVLERVSTPYVDMISGEGAYARAYLGGEEGLLGAAL